MLINWLKSFFYNPTLNNLAVRQLLYDDGWKMLQDYPVYRFQKNDFEVWFSDIDKKYVLTNESRDNPRIYIFKNIPTEKEILMCLNFIKKFPLVIKYNFSNKKIILKSC